MDQEHLSDMMKHVKIYIFVFVALAILTLVTVWASHLQVNTTYHIIIALSIASLKAALVALFFMHLISEKKAIYGVLIFTVVFFFVLLLITLLTNNNMLRSSQLW